MYSASHEKFVKYLITLFQTIQNNTVSLHIFIPHGLPDAKTGLD